MNFIQLKVKKSLQLNPLLYICKSLVARTKKKEERSKTKDLKIKNQCWQSGHPACGRTKTK
jgi:hypothetical protein